MKINGREIKFLRTVKATAELSKLCPNEDIEKLGEVMNGGLAQAIEAEATIVHLLNEGYEMNKHFNDRSYKPNVLSVEEIMYLDEKEFVELVTEAWASMNNGAETTIEVEEPKKKEANEQVN